MSNCSSVSPLRLAKEREEASLKHRAEELERDNFNLKLRIYYLEENLGQIHPGAASEILKLNAELRSQLDEKTRVLEERDVLLVKARNAIDSLQADLELAKAESFREISQSAEEIRRNQKEAKELKQVQEALEQSQRQHQTDIEVIAARDATIVSMRSQLTEHSEKLKQCQETLRGLKDVKEELATVQSSFTRTKEKLASANAHLENAQANEKRLASELEELKYRTAAFSRDHSEAVSRHEKFHGESIGKIEEMQNHCRSLRERHQQEVAQLHKQIAEANAKIASFDRLQREYELDITRTKDENKLLKGRIDLLTESLRSADSEAGKVYSNTMSALSGAREAELARERDLSAQKLSKERSAREDAEERLRQEQEVHASLQRTMRQNNASTIALIHTVEHICQALHSLSIPSFAISSVDRVEIFNDDVCPPVLGGDAGSVTMEHLDMLSLWVKRKIHRLKMVRRAFSAAASKIEDHFNSRMDKIEKLVRLQDKHISDVESRVAVEWARFAEHSKGASSDSGGCHGHVDRLRSFHHSVLESLQRINAELGPGEESLPGTSLRR